jgi:hypothetical protein
VSGAPDDEAAYREHWHTEHYRRSVGNELVGPLWDALVDGGEQGSTVPQLRDRLADDRRVRQTQSWYLSFGAEQRLRPGARYQQRYRGMDPDLRLGIVPADEEIAWTWTPEQRFRYALTERVHREIVTMRNRGSAVLVGTSGDSAQKSELLYGIIAKGRGAFGDRLPLYAAGTVPLVTALNPRCECGKVHHTTYKRPWVYHEGLGPDPFALRQTWLEEARPVIDRGVLPQYALDLLRRAADLLDEQ